MQMTAAEIKQTTTLVRQPRALADTTRRHSWMQHFRRHNKMADSLANLAMDRRRRQEDEQSSDRQIERRYPGILRLVLNGFTHWKDSTDGRNPVTRVSSLYES
ncbi:hypothetical protein PHMEG_0005804 [Phytophthora megakarya]|uniref:RNase H type-1 domain-containing protein n=1 Tax=Phytophthora megakarya TaxID=4795 RepID=A0A225WRS9_9STRA|nr:hypothetical protein PHMEG_0005804 [Phytophthora megakarya]